MAVTHKQIVKAINDLLPNAQFILSDLDWDNIQWLDKRPQPNWSEIENAIENPLPEPEPTVQEKLALVGLSVDDLKSALGL